ncbi:MAG: hypothetical protein E6R04_02140 [Spirochaetes bacterium]|nr:MAG: hypothetical protein E6R04_02140 [Spirochaetota bacterium]
MEDTLFYLGEWNLSPGLNVLVFLSGERYLGIASHLFGGSRHPVIFVECEKTISSAVVRAAEPFYSKYAHATVAPKLVEEEPTPPMGNDENETKKPNIFSKMLGLFDLLRLFRT